MNLAYLAILISFGIAGIVAGALTALLQLRFVRPKPSRREPLEADLMAALTALQENSRRATELLTRLQDEVSKRSGVVRELEGQLEALKQQRTLLELTPEQQEAIQSLVRRAPSIPQILTSVDFWVGRVAVSTVFFLLGIGVTLLIGR